MIASLHGTLEIKSSDWVIINVSGIGFQVFMPTSALSELGATKEVHIHTHLHLREDNATLYGFLSIEDLNFFEMLLGVTGVGPKLALSVLSTMTSEQAIMFIASGNVEMLETVPGIGKKLAARLLLELKDKVGAVLVTTSSTQLAQGNADVLAALTSLGYSVSEATRAIASLPPSSKLTLEEKVKLTLQYFGQK